MNSPKTISGQSQNDFGTTGAEVVPLSRISIDTGLRDNPDPIESEPIRILLSEATSRHLTETEESVFVVAAKAPHPDDPKRWILYLVPTSIPLADAAARVARGLSRESKPRTPKP
jgi:hypothetical protein